MKRYWLGGKRHREQDVFFEEALDPTRWEPGDADRWDTCWYTGMPRREVFRATAPGRTINHIPGNAALTVKSRLWRTVRTLRERMAAAGNVDAADPARLDFVPRVYRMPEDYHELQRVARDEPDTRWLLKPRNAARGKDIRLLEDVAEAPVEERWMVQEYLGRPHLMNDRKYVLRLYVLITSIEPLRVYLYEQGFAKLASAPYSEAEQGNPYAYLTNPDVNARNEDAESPVVFVDLERYRGWLREQGHDDEPLFARLRDMVALTCIAARETMRERSLEAGAHLESCYEFLGMDCLVDQDLRPWLLECNLSPSLGVLAAPEDGGDMEAAVKRRMIEDVVATVNLNGVDPEPTEGDPEIAIPVQAEAERARAGGFQRVFPDADAGRFLRYFPFPRLADMVLADAVSAEPVTRPQAERWQASEIVTDDRLTLYSETGGALYSTNPAAAIIWLQATAGHDPDDVARDIASGAPWGVRRQVWDALADWARAGLLMQGPSHADALAQPSAPPQAEAPTAGSSVHTFLVRCGATSYRLRTWSTPAAQRLAPLLEPLTANAGADDGVLLDIASSRLGFTILVEGSVVAEHLRLTELAPWLANALLHRAAGGGELAFAGAVVGPPSEHAAEDAGRVLVARGGPEADDALAVALARSCGWSAHGGARLAPGAGGAAPLGLPLRTDERLSSCAGGPWWWYGQRGRLTASDPADPDAWRPVSTVLLPVNDDEQGGALLRAAAVDEALSHLLPLTVGPGGASAEAAAVSRLVDWLTGTARYFVAPRELPDVAAALEKPVTHATDA